ncbi:fibronectin type III domain-containing protein [Nitrospira sp. BLG_2]|uniref:fibronectin type III domain-containing protein n=1 Tax=Nitrospira sp. BLG_2 TaxID=3397507 RepID=UPI003B9B0AE7
MDFARSIVNHYQCLLICLFQFTIIACTSPEDSTPTSEMVTATSETATLSWNANSEPDLEGYKIYLGTVSGGYDAPIATVPVDVTSYTITGLDTGTTYFFSVTAYNSSGAESSFSNEVSKTAL